MTRCLLLLLLCITILSPTLSPTLLAKKKYAYHAITPYIGYRLFYNSDYANQIEIGVTITEYILSSIVGLEAGVSIIPTIKKNSTSKTHFLTPFHGGGLIRIGPLERIYAYGGAGIWTDYEKSELKYHPYTNGGLFITINPTSALRLGLTTGFTKQLKVTDRLAYFGIETLLNGPFVYPEKTTRKRKTRRQKKYQKTKHNQQKRTGKEIEVEQEKEAPQIIEKWTIETPDALYRHLMSKESVTDISLSKEIKDIQTVVQLGIMSTNKGRFRPNETLDTQTVETLLAKVAYLYGLREKAQGSIHYKIGKKEGVPYTASLRIYKKNKLVKTIFKKKRHYLGDYKASWDGTDNKGHILPSGTYRTELKVYYKDKRLVKRTATTELRTYQSPTLISDPETDKPTPMFKNPVDPQWATHINNEINEKKLFSKQNKSPITKLETIQRLAKVLTILGVDTTPLPDTWLYRDIETIPAYALTDIHTYVTALGYSGEANDLFNPNQTITRAQMARFIMRVMRWKTGKKLLYTPDRNP